MRSLCGSGGVVGFMHIQGSCDEFVVEATRCCCHDNNARQLGVSLSLSLPPPPSLPPSFSGLEPVIMVLFTCNTLSNLFTILIHFAICVLTWISYIRLCHLFIFCELTGSSLSGFLLFWGKDAFSDREMRKDVVDF